MSKEIKYDIQKTYLELPSGKKVVKISWNGNNPTIDIRRFSDDGIPMKGISLKEKELKDVIKALEKAYSDSDEKEDNRESVDLRSVLKDVPDIVDLREKGYITKNGKIKLELIKK